MKLKAFIFLLIPTLCFLQRTPIPISKIQDQYLDNDYKSTIEELNFNITYYSSVPTEKLNLVRCYNLLGEIYLSENEFERAFKQWQKGFDIAQIAFGNKSIYMAEVYTMYSKYYSFLIKQDSSFKYSKMAIDLCKKNKSEVAKIPIHKIYRQYAFPSKIFYENADKFKSRLIARNLRMSSN